MEFAGAPVPGEFDAGARQLDGEASEGRWFVTQNNKNEILAHNLVSSIKQYLPTLVELGSGNDINGRWLPTFTRLQITRVLLKFKEEDKILGISYNVKDYLEYYSYWPAVLQLCPTDSNEKKLIEYIHNLMCKQSPFDAKLKSLVLVRKILDK